ncbi:MAG: hypothetical protein ACREAZ_01880 [Nitrososphaera sp.]
MIAKALSLLFVLLAAAILPTLESAAAQSPTLTLKSSSEKYDLGDTAKVTGKVSPLVSNKNVEIQWVKPDRKIILANILPNSDGSFTSTIELDEDEVTGGKWKVVATYSNASASITFIVQDPFFEVQIADSISGDDVFEAGEQVTVEGEIYNKDEEERVTITIFNSNGNFFQSVLVKLDSREFTHSFSLEGSRVSYGEWIIDLRYQGGYRSALTFEVIPSPLSIDSNKGWYLPGDTAFITGNVSGSATTSEALVTIVVTNPVGVMFSSASVPLRDDDSFAYELHLVGWSAAAFGIWNIVVEYDKHKATATFGVREPTLAITAKTNKPEFKVGEPVIVTGRVSELGGSDIVPVHFFTESGRLYKYVEAKVQQNFTYTYELIPDQNLAPGNYEILATHAGKEARTTFIVKKPTPVDDVPDIITTNKTVAHTYRVRMDDGDHYDVKYSLTQGNSIKNMTTDIRAKTLSVVIDSGSDGTLTIELPRVLIDSLDKDGGDTKYLVSRVYSNGTIDTATFVEANITEKERTLVMNFGRDTDLIVVTGTQVIPEFGGLHSTALMASASMALATTYLVRLRNRKSQP